MAAIADSGNSDSNSGNPGDGSARTYGDCKGSLITRLQPGTPSTREDLVG
jgi:hypothetical protein